MNYLAEKLAVLLKLSNNIKDDKNDIINFHPSNVPNWKRARDSKIESLKHHILPDVIMGLLNDIRIEKVHPIDTV